MSWFGWGETINLKEWCVAHLYKFDAGLFEIEQEYARKKLGIKELRIDRSYNQLEGKFTALIALMSDFRITLPPQTSTRILKRIKLRKGTLIFK